MNAYELADYVENTDCEYIQYSKVSTMLRQQADRITMLEKETSALRKQLIAACNELMEIKR
jgi:hypothetical protein